jgi:hypothetical protein
MFIANQLATSFITPFSEYCYQTMPFGLKNAGATFQRCMRHVFRELIGCIIEAYIDNIVVNSKKIGDLVPDLTKVFANLRQHGVKLNPEKYIFGAPRGMLLGFVVSECGIEANPEKISAIMDMGPIKNLKGVQRVSGSLAASSPFIARLGERSPPLYKLMKSDHFTWTPEAQEALESFKNMLKSPPILTALIPEEPMLLYISATTQVVSAALVVEREEPERSQKVQQPVYFVSEVLSNSKMRYRQMQKLVYAILMTKRKLRHYFDAHPITVVSKVPTRGSHPEPRGRREDRQVGPRADGTEHNLCTTQCHQVASTRGLRGRVDGDSNSLDVNRARDMDHIFRRLGHEGRSRCRPCLHLASRRAHGVLGTTTLPGIEQRRRV